VHHWCKWRYHWAKHHIIDGVFDHWQNSPFWATAFLGRFCQICLFLITCRRSDHPILTSLDFAIIILFRTARSSSLRLTPNPEDQVLVFISPSDGVAQLYPQAPGSLFVTFYDSQGDGGGTLTRLHTGKSSTECPEISRLRDFLVNTETKQPLDKISTHV
jgi:hypothetical protein